MPFSFRRCFTKLPKALSPETSPSSRFKDREAEGYVEAKHVVPGETFVFKAMWKHQYCVIESDGLRLYHNENCQKLWFSATKPIIREFSVSYRMRRRSSTPQNPWPKLECCFTIITQLDDTLKIRVHGEEDAHYWASRFFKFFGKTFCPCPTNPPSFSKWSRGQMCDPFGFGSPNESHSKAKPVSVPINDHDPQYREVQTLRRRLAAEFVETLRRTDTMLEGRQTALRAQLKDRNYSMESTKIDAISDDEGSMTPLSKTVVTSLGRSTCIRPSIIKSQGSGTMVQSLVMDEPTKTSPATIRGELPADGLPTIVDDERPISSETRFTSSASIRLGNRRAPMNLASIDYSGRTYEGESTAASVVVNTASRVTRDIVTYSLASSPTGLSTSTPTEMTPFFKPIPSFHEFMESPTCPPPAPPAPPPPMVHKSMATKITKIPKLSKVGQASFNREKSLKIDEGKAVSDSTTTHASAPSLPSSFLTELREAAFKRRMSMKNEDDSMF